MDTYSYYVSVCVVVSVRVCCAQHAFYIGKCGTIHEIYTMRIGVDAASSHFLIKFARMEKMCKYVQNSANSRGRTRIAPREKTHAESYQNSARPEIAEQSSNYKMICKCASYMGLEKSCIRVGVSVVIETNGDSFVVDTAIEHITTFDTQ